LHAEVLTVMIKILYLQTVKKIFVLMRSMDEKTAKYFVNKRFLDYFRVS